MGCFPLVDHVVLFARLMPENSIWLHQDIAGSKLRL